MRSLIMEGGECGVLPACPSFCPQPPKPKLVDIRLWGLALALRCEI